MVSGMANGHQFELRRLEIWWSVGDAPRIDPFVGFDGQVRE